jgi:N-acetylmuramoyl-L-alanine amidase
LGCGVFPPKRTVTKLRAFTGKFLIALTIGVFFLGMSAISFRAIGATKQLVPGKNAKQSDVVGAEKIRPPTKIKQTAIAFGGRLLGDQHSARLLINLDSKVEVQPFYMSNPPRLVIDLSKTAFRFQEPDNFKPRGLVADFRYGTMARGRSRIVISLVEPVKITGQKLRKTQRNRFQFTIDLEKVDAAEFAKQIAKQRDTVGTSGNVVTKGDRVRPSAKRAGRLTIVLDPGHGGIDGGANGKNGGLEKDITLAVALQLEKSLKAAGPFDVYLTRREDHFLSLKERVKISIRRQSDLFISIHADTLNQKKVRGAAIYTLSGKASDEFSKKLAESENRADLMAGLSSEKVHDEIVDILADLAARETKKFSVRFAKHVVDTFRNNIELIKNPHRNAAFEVLKDPGVPSVLLELGYLSNQQDEKLLLSVQWQEKLAHHLTQAVGLFFSNRVQ